MCFAASSERLGFVRTVGPRMLKRGGCGDALTCVDS